MLRKGQVAAALFADDTSKQAQNFSNYLNKHRHHIVNYQYHQAEQICSIGSSSTVVAEVA